MLRPRFALLALLPLLAVACGARIRPDHEEDGPQGSTGPRNKLIGHWAAPALFGNQEYLDFREDGTVLMTDVDVDVIEGTYQIAPAGVPDRPARPGADQSQGAERVNVRVTFPPQHRGGSVQARTLTLSGSALREDSGPYGPRTFTYAGPPSDVHPLDLPGPEELYRVGDLSVALSSLLGGPGGSGSPGELIGTWEAEERGQRLSLEFQPDDVVIFRLLSPDGQELGTNRGTYRILDESTCDMMFRTAGQDQPVRIRYVLVGNELRLTAPNGNSLVLRRRGRPEGNRPW
jgi:hypothetical protein